MAESSKTKITLKNRAKATRGIQFDGGTVNLNPGETREVDVPDYMVQRLQESSEKGGDLEVVGGGQRAGREQGGGRARMHQRPEGGQSGE